MRLPILLVEDDNFKALSQKMKVMPISKIPT